MSSGVLLQEIHTLFKFLEQSKTNNDMQIIINNDMCKALYDLVINCKKENDRLNNIISELEKYLRNEYSKFNGAIRIANILDKLKELKEGK